MRWHFAGGVAAPSGGSRPSLRNQSKWTVPLLANTPATRPVKDAAVSADRYRPSSSARVTG